MTPYFVISMTIFLNKCIFIYSNEVSGGMLYPRESENRELKELNGMWNFRADTSLNRSQGFSDKWFLKSLSATGPVIPMPVPSSYNDITQDKWLRDFIGWVWYDQEFYVSTSWLKGRVVLRFDSVRYYGVVWVNGVKVAEHEMGHLPFEADLTSLVKYGGVNRLTVAVNNTMTPTTLPPGNILHKSGSSYPSNYMVQTLNFGFFNYAGIDRSVRLYTTPNTYIDDITVYSQPSMSGTADGLGTSFVQGRFEWNIKIKGPNAEKSKLSVEIVDKSGGSVFMGSGFDGKAMLSKIHPWWPYSMDPSNPGYMYTLKVTLVAGDSVDVYRLPFGFRSVSVATPVLFINDRPFYCHGVGKHEDYDIRGKGVDNALIAKDFNLLKWLGVNCFRTSHYPYAEEIMDQADQQGIMVIDECPAVGLVEEANFSNKTLMLHKSAMRELHRRDKNRPSVLMWSVANEPRSTLAISGPYFREIVTLTKQMDPYHPVTFASSNGNPATDHVMNQVDVICVNYYSGWYNDSGHTEVIPYHVTNLIKTLHQAYNLPVIISEYGAESLPGLHVSPSAMYSEEYQHDFLSVYHKTFDTLREQYLAGEMVWNFADFMIYQGVSWPYGCHKGLFTRQRQPKYAAHLVRDRYHKLIEINARNISTKFQGHRVEG